MTSRSRLTFIVPTVGLSPHLRSCVEALERQGENAIVVATDRTVETTVAEILGATRILPVPERAGFCETCNRALAGVATEFVALVNDDAIVGQSWATELVTALEADPDAAGAQGTNVRLESADVVDGCGIAWNQRWQAVQLDRGRRRSDDRRPREVFGVSATAAVFRRQALEAVALGASRYFDPALHTYYEDVDLACRLRSRGFRALHVPAATAGHAGGVSTARRRTWRLQQIYGNRLLVLARLWGRRFAGKIHRLAMRDLLEAVAAGLRLDARLCVGIGRGWLRAISNLSRFAHRGEPLVPDSTLRRFQVAVGRERAAG